MAKRTPTEPKTALAGVMLATSFARFRAPMATFNAERTSLSFPFCSCDSVSIARAGGGKEEYMGYGEKLGV